MVDLAKCNPKAGNLICYTNLSGAKKFTRIASVGTSTVSTGLGTWALESGELLVDPRFKATGMFEAAIRRTDELNCAGCGGQMEHDGLNAWCPWAGCISEGYHLEGKNSQ